MKNSVLVGLLCVLVSGATASSGAGSKSAAPRTEFTRTLALGGGRFAAEVASAPINRLDANGGRQPAGTDGADSVFPDQATWWTGYIRSGTKISSAIIKFGDDGLGTAEGWSKFDLASIPDGAVISAVTLRYYGYYFYTQASAAPVIRVFQPAGTDPVTADAATILSAIAGGTVVSDSAESHAAGWVSRDLKAAGVTAVQNRLTDDWIAFGFHETRPSPGYGGHVYGWNQISPDYRPRLIVTYTIPVDIVAVSAGTYTYPLVEGEVDSVKASFSNTGASTATDTRIYALRGGAKFDSLTLASFPAGTDTTVYFRLTTPPTDASRQYFAFVARNPQDANLANDTVKYDDWSFPAGTYQAEGFDYAATFPPAGWTTINNDGGSSVWSLANGLAHSGTRSAWCSFESGRSDDWLVTSWVIPAADHVDSIGFFYATRLGGTADTLEVYAMRGQTVGDTIGRLLRVSTNWTTYQPARISLQPFAGQQVYIGFRKIGRSSNQLLLDDIWWMRRSGDDVGVAQIRAPADTVVEGTVVAPSVLVRNYGIRDATFDVRFLIKQSGVSAYDTTETGVFLHAGDSTIHVFAKTWDARPQVTCSLTAYTICSADSFHRDDTIHDVSVVVPAANGGWVEREPMPLTPSGRYVKDGGWLSYMFMNGSVYAAKGDKTGDFYSYSPAGNSWLQRSQIPAGPEGKLPGKGTFGVSDGLGHVYMVKGNNTVAYWRYDVSGDSWHKLVDVPVGLSGKKIKGGDGLAYVANPPPDTDYVYLLKGQKSEFYRYNVGSGAWQTLPEAPIGFHPKWDMGSWRVYDDNRTIYGLKGKANEFWAYDLATGAWGTNPKSGLPTVGRSGRLKKSGDGGGGAWFGGAVYALKGGNTQEFWKYRPAPDSWVEIETIPAFGATRKKKLVKSGGGIITAEDAMYALKGNKCDELWMYRPASYRPEPEPGREGVMAAGLAVGDCRLAISPNPVKSGSVTIRLSSPVAASSFLRVYDATGRLVHLSFGLRNSPFRLDLRSMPAGVYLVRLDSGGQTWHTKLVVQE